MTRSTVDAAVVVCSVPKTRCPVSAVSIAMATVSRSRISPTSTMSGSSRRAARSAFVNDLDRILDRDDVIVARPVHVVDHRAQRRRLAGAGGAGDEHEALVQLAE